MNTTTAQPAPTRFMFPAIVFGMLLCGASLSAAQEPVLGTWQWDKTRETFTVQPDGTAVQGNRIGQWVCVNATANPRVYQINWEQGVNLDTLYLVHDGTQLIGQDRTTYNLLANRVASAPAPAATDADVSTPEGYIDQLAEQLPRAKEWVLAPLDTPVPASVQQTFDTIDATLQAEAANVPQADLEVYRQGWGVWRDLMAVWHERAAWLRRNYELNHGGAFPEAWRAAWAERARLVESRFASSFNPFHEAVRSHPRWAAASLAYEGHRYSAPGAAYAAPRYERHAPQGGPRAFAPHTGHALPQIAAGPAHHPHAPHAGGHRAGSGGHGHRR